MEIKGNEHKVPELIWQGNHTEVKKSRYKYYGKNAIAVTVAFYSTL